MRLSFAHHEMPHAGSQRGFTLIELLVGIVLMGIFGTVILKVVVDGFAGADRAMSRDRAVAYAVKAKQQIDSDLRSARALDRDSDTIRSVEQLRLGVLYDRPLFDYRNERRQLDIHDISTANERRLVFQSDVVAPNISEGPECVVYQASSPGSEKWSLSRFVYAYQPRCGGRDGALAGQPLSQTYLVPPLEADLAPEGGKVFSYVFMYEPKTENANPRDNSPSRWHRLLEPENCERKVRPKPRNAPATDINKITAVQLDLRTFVGNSAGASEASLRFAVGVRTRSNYDYLYAMGCIS